MTANTNLVPELSPELQIDAIRLQMKQQRQLIEDQLTQATAENNAYPRSMTMRFLTQKRGLMLLAEVSTFFLGARALKSIGKTIAFVRSVYS
jgi:hypothetical protein